MITQAYERPSIQRHQMGAMNKFGRLEGMRPLTHIDGVAVAELVAEHGSPLFVFSEKTLIRRYRELHEAFARRWAKVRIAWSYKTNYLEAVCRVFHREGAWAEVVSPFELDKAIQAGVPADRVHWNGPYKPDAAIVKALAGGTTLHLDNLDELSRVERIAERMGLRPKVAIRVNMAIEGLPQWSRFGFNLESGQAREADQSPGERRPAGARGPALPHRHLHPRPRRLPEGRRQARRARQRDPRRARDPPLLPRPRRRLRLAQHPQGAVPPRRAGRALLRPLRRRHLRRPGGARLSRRGAAHPGAGDGARAGRRRGVSHHHRGGQQAPPRRAPRPGARRRRQPALHLVLVQARCRPRAGVPRDARAHRDVRAAVHEHRRHARHHVISRPCRPGIGWCSRTSAPTT